MAHPERLFDLVVLADLTPGRRSPRLERVDRDRLPALMSEWTPSLALGGATLAFAEPRDFRPERLAAALPATRALLELRKRVRSSTPPSGAELLAALDALDVRSPDVDRLRGALRGSGAAPGVSAAPAPAATPPPPAAAPARFGDPAGSIFDMVDTGASSAARDMPAPAGAATRALDALVGQLVGASRSGGALPSATLRGIEQAVDEAMAGALRETLHAPAFQTLECAWRGLRDLVRAVDFRSGIRMHVGAVPVAGMAAMMDEHVAPLVSEAQHEGRAVVVVCDAAFGLDDVGSLATLAELAMELRTPLIASAAPGGFDALAAEGGGSGDALARWLELRSGEASRWVSLTFNRLLARTPYGAQLDPVRDFAFEENPVGGEARYAWANGALPLARLIASSVERRTWAVDCAGPGEAGTIEALPVRPFTTRTGEVLNLPVEALISEPQLLALADSGLLAWTARRNTDAAFTVSLPSLHAPAAVEMSGKLEEARRASFTYCLMLAQVGASFARALDRATGTDSAEERANAIARSLEQAWTTDDGPTLAVTGVARGGRGIAIEIRPIAGPVRGIPTTSLEFA